MIGVFRTNRAILISTLFTILIIIGSASNNIAVNPGESSVETQTITQLIIPSNSYTFHGPIDINSNADFSSQGWPGSGTSGDPYVIEGLNITSDALCIHIIDTTAYFEVKDCMISSVGSISLHEGICLENVIHGAIRDTIIDRHYRGISLYDSSICTLTNNTATINYWSGLSLIGSDNCTLTNNTATSNSQFGFNLISSNNCILTNNTAMSNDYGFYLSESNNCTLVSNTLARNGINIDGWSVSHWLHYFSNNTVNNKPMGYFKNLTSIIIDGSRYGQVIAANCTEIKVKDGIFTDVSVGIQLGFCANSTIANNTATDNSLYGFYLRSSDNCTLTNNTVSDNQLYGIYLGTGCEYNRLYLNRLGNNSESNAKDNGGSNSWDDGVSSGNYWLDYNGTGIYQIPGSAGSVDNYPFVWEPVTTTTTTSGVETIMMILVLSGAGITVLVIVIIVVMRKRQM